MIIHLKDGAELHIIPEKAAYLHFILKWKWISIINALFFLLFTSALPLGALL